MASTPPAIDAGGGGGGGRDPAARIDAVGGAVGRRAADAARAGDIDGAATSARWRKWRARSPTSPTRTTPTSEPSSRRARSPLVALLGDASASHRGGGRDAPDLAACDDNKGAIVGAKALGPLVAVLTGGTDTARHAAGALAKRQQLRRSPGGDRGAGAVPPLALAPAAAGAPSRHRRRRRRRRAAGVGRVGARRVGAASPRHNANSDAIVAAGGIDTLVGALARGVGGRRAG